MLEDPRVEEGTIMGGRCARVSGELLALADFKKALNVVSGTSFNSSALCDAALFERGR